MARKLLWIVPVIFYFIFTFWYTNTGGPLSQEEIDQYTTKMREAGFTGEQVDGLRQFMESDTGRQFLMVNNLDMAEDPEPVAGAGPNETAGQLLDRYMEYMYPALLKRACHPVYVGNAVFRSMDIVGIENAENWDRAALMRYRSRRDLLDITSNPAFQGRHEFKVAALTKTIAYPLENVLYLSDPRFLLALILTALIALTDIALYGRR